MKISFDFDSTLDTLSMQLIAKKFLELGAEVYVVTTRGKIFNGKQLNNDDVFEVTDLLGIKRKNIIFTKHEDKVYFVKDFDIHFDDDLHEIYLINQDPCKCIGFLYEEYQPSANGIVEY